MWLACALLISFVVVGFSPNSSLSADPATIHNPDRGAWDSEPDRGLHFVHDLTIGTEDGEADNLFGRIADLAIDANGNILVLDSGFYKIKTYDSAGTFVRSFGRKGEGPGELTFPTAITVGVGGRVLIADNNFIEVLDEDGGYVDQFRLPYSELVFSLKADAGTGWIYVSCLDVLEQKIIHVFDEEYQHVVSFCESWATGKDLDLRVERATAGGKIDIDPNGIIYFTQMAPYEIRKFEPTGELLCTIHRKNTFLPAPDPQIGDGGTVFGLYAMSSSIVVLNSGWFLNVVSLANQDNSMETVIDLFSAEGELLISRRYPGSLYLKEADAAGRVYAIDASEYPAVKRYRIETGALPLSTRH